jgi:hypothetical protein
MATVYISKEDNDHVRFVNDTGAALVQYEATVVGPYAAVADEAIASTAVGSYHVEEGIEVQIADLVTSEDTFGTPGQAVYFDPTSGDFSDTETAGYYLWGYLKTAKNSDGMIVVEKLRYAVLVTT